MSAREPAPTWFQEALAHRPGSRWTSSQGAPIHYLAWESDLRIKPRLLFVHGMMGHAHWWDFIAPFFTKRFQVFALDLSGMGESGHRTSYTRETFVEDIAAVLRDTGHAPATVVGHSFGGARLFDACASVPGMIGHAVVLDSRYEATASRRDVGPDRPHKVYASREEALAHFRLMPEQPCPDWLREHLALHSIRPNENGWIWRFDPNLRTGLSISNDPSLLLGIRVPVTYMYGGESALLTAQRAQEIVSALPDGRGPIVLPGAGHHLMLNDTPSFIATLDSVLQQT